MSELNDRRSTRLVAVSNRLPITLERTDSGWKVNPGGGGLVRALAPILSDRGGMWIGWHGISEEVDVNLILKEARQPVGYKYHTVALAPQEVEGFYNGFANQVIWPLFHDLQTRCNFDPWFYNTYKDVNRKFAEMVGRVSGEGDYIWVQDYHLIHVGRMMHLLGIQRRTGFFLHIPFPSVDIFLKLPWRDRVLQALLEYDLIGLQTLRDRRNLLACLQYLRPDVKVISRGGPVLTLEVGERQVRLGSFPISIDFATFASRAATAKVSSRTAWIRKGLMGSRLILGTDRLDYTKGLPERLLAFENLLERYPEYRAKVTLVQVVVPSREAVTEYRTLKSEVERLVGEINGRFTKAGWVPIHYIYRNLEFEDLLAYYRAADIALVTPLKDGMNLIAKEYCASHVDDDGVLILSEFAGAASQMQRDALLVNPYDIEGVADAIHQALAMPPEERRNRMRRLREGVRRNDIFRWVDSYLEAAFSINLDHIPPVEEYIPQIKLDVEGRE